LRVFLTEPKGAKVAYVCSATWVATNDSVATVADSLANLSAASRKEPGNLYYQVYQNPDEPNKFRIFEVYQSKDAFEKHAASEHFKQWALDRAIPLLESRNREFFETLDF
jgi:quinol monooxygenase YgiN